MNFKSKWIASPEQLENRQHLADLLKNTPIPDLELLQNLGLYINSPSLSRMFFMNDIYEKILDVHGVVMEFGVRWGHNLALFSNFRSIYEPYNFNRKIIGFDTFEGFPSVNEKDQNQNSANDFLASTGDFNVTSNYECYLDEILRYHEQENPLPHIKKYQIIKGDAVVELEKWLFENPETIIALAYFDLDLYEPTKGCLELIKSYLTKGSIIGLDELNHHHFPGETLAFKEVFGLDRFSIRRSRYSRINSYVLIE